MHDFIVASALAGLLHGGCYELGYGPDVVYGGTTASGDPVYYAVNDSGQYLPWYWTFDYRGWSYAPYGEYRDFHDDYTERERGAPLYNLSREHGPRTGGHHSTYYGAPGADPAR